MANERPSPIILASASPRRRQLLSEAGYQFEIVKPDVDESVFPTQGMTTREYAETLALAKARSVAPMYPDHWVIGADTVVDFAGEIIGKPVDADDAERITKKLFSAPHQVITSVAIIKLCDDIELVESDITTVYPKTMTAGQIAEHIKGGTWRDKAGAYAIQETGDAFVERIEGSLTNVMGLPMELLDSLLTKML
ncbi:MAG: septum formation protein Maf [Sedimentisphaerales bacterium]|nr:septum formation protein Maf [Sedimentisphaerales bacterium]